MATFRKRLGKWEVRVRKLNNKTISKTFIEKADANRWAQEVETKIEKGLYEDLSQAKFCVPGPNGSEPCPQNVCQYAIANLKCSFMVLPATTWSGL